MSEECNLTDKEETCSATYFDDIWFTSKYNRYHALRGDQIFYCENPLGCHVSSRTGRVSRAFHTDYHRDCPRSYLVLPSHACRLVAVICRVL
jgi:hypothetical protein